MRSSLPKHLHPLLGRRVVDWVIDAAGQAGVGRLVVVAAPDTRDAYEGVEVAVQEEPLGTGDAVAVGSGRARRLRRPRARTRRSRAAAHRRAPRCPRGRARAAGCRGHDPVRRAGAAAAVRPDRPRRPTAGWRRSSRSKDATDEQRADPRAELVDLRVRGRTAVGITGQAGHAERPGRAATSPTRSRISSRGADAQRPGSVPIRSPGSGSTRGSSWQSQAPCCATGSTRRTCLRG